MLSLWLNVLAGGVPLGLVYGLVALGLTITFGVMRVVNSAHSCGELLNNTEVQRAYLGM